MTRVSVGCVLSFPGAVLRFSVPLPMAPVGAIDGDETVRLTFNYLTSYEHMGRLTMSCADGCSCATQYLDAHHGERFHAHRCRASRLVRDT